MIDLLLIFIAQFCSVYLLGLQSLTVRDNHYILAAILSSLLGVTGFITVSIIGGMNKNDLLTIFGVVYIIAGPIAIVTAIRTHPIIRQWFLRN